jgi:hypothetical protein
MATPSLATLVTATTKEKLYNFALGVATALGLPVSSWQAGDPTRSLYHVESESLATWEQIVVAYIMSGFLDYATGAWLKILAYQVYGVVVPEATYASTDVVLTNGGGGLFANIEPGSLVFKNSTTGKTYRNTTGGTLASGPGTTLTVTVVAEEAGSDSSAAAEEIDEMVTRLRGVTCSNALAAVGVDEQDEAVTRQQCRNRISRISPNGAKGAYVDVALDSDLTGTSAIIDARSYGDSDVGDVLVYLRGASGAVADADRDLVEEAILSNCTPLCITPTVLSVVNVTVAVTYQLWVYKKSGLTADEIEERVEAALEQMFARRPIGGDIVAPASTGKLYRSFIESTIQAAVPEAFRVSVSAPSGDTSLDNGEVAALGTITPTIHIEVDP